MQYYCRLRNLWYTSYIHTFVHKYIHRYIHSYILIHILIHILTHISYTGIAVPDAIFEDILLAIQGDNDCIDGECFDTDFDKYPTLLFKLDPGTSFTMLPSDYLLCVEDECVLRIQSSGEFIVVNHCNHRRYI